MGCVASRSEIFNHKSKIGSIFCFAVLLTVAAVGCSTPESRIRENPGLFATFPAGVQERVRRGRVAVGFPRPAVRMALGEPDRVFTRTEAGGVVKEVWSYTGYEYESTTYSHAGLHGHSFHHGHPHLEHGFFEPIRVERRRPYEKLRIIFGEDGTVRSIERMRR